MRISLKAINSELERLGSQALLARGDGYFYFWGGEAADRLDRTVWVALPAAVWAFLGVPGSWGAAGFSVIDGVIAHSPFAVVTAVPTWITRAGRKSNRILRKF